MVGMGLWSVSCQIAAKIDQNDCLSVKNRWLKGNIFGVGIKEGYIIWGKQTKTAHQLVKITTSVIFTSHSRTAPLKCFAGASGTNSEKNETIHNASPVYSQFGEFGALHRAYTCTIAGESSMQCLPFGGRHPTLDSPSNSTGAQNCTIAAYCTQCS